MIRQLTTIRNPMLSTSFVQQTVFQIPTNELLQRFIKLQTNIVVIGEKFMTIAYARAKDLKYVSAVRTRNYKWCNVVTYLEEVIKKHCCPGANVLVYHHRLGLLGSVKKSGVELFMPVGVTKIRKGLIVPEAIKINVLPKMLEEVTLNGWQALL